MAEEKQMIGLSGEDREWLRRIADIIGAVHDPEADPRFHEDDARFLRSLADRPQGGDAIAAGHAPENVALVAGGRAGDGSAPDQLQAEARAALDAFDNHGDYGAPIAVLRSLLDRPTEQVGVDGLVEALKHAQEVVGAESVSADEEVRLLDHIGEALANYRNQQEEGG